MKHTISRRVRTAFLGTASLCLAAGGLAVLSSGAAQAVNAKAPPPLDHFLCYKAGPSFQLKVGISLKDPVHPVLYQPKPVNNYAHCNPANKVVPGAKFLCAEPARAPVVLRHHRAVEVEDRDDEQPVRQGRHGDRTRRRARCACRRGRPTPRNPNMTPTAPPGLDHFTCYPVKKTSRTASSRRRPSRPRTSSTRRCTPRSSSSVATQLCVPTLKIDVTGKPFPPMTATDLSLLCFPTSPTPRWNARLRREPVRPGPRQDLPADGDQLERAVLRADDDHLDRVARHGHSSDEGRRCTRRPSSRLAVLAEVGAAARGPSP